MQFCFSAISRLSSRMAFSLSLLSQTVFRIVESDRFGEHPFLYLIAGENKMVLIDTGCGSGDLSEFIRKDVATRPEIPEAAKSKLLVINSHNHFDHVGANFRFSPESGPKSPECLDLCAGNLDKEYTLDPYNTVGHIVGCEIEPYKITRWLSDGEKIPLSDDGTNYLEVLNLPGHTPDSIALYYPKENRLFVADFIYRCASILAAGVKSDFGQYEESARKLVEFLDAQEKSGNKVVLSCGHVDEKLDSSYARRFLDFLVKIREKRISGSKVYGGRAVQYENEDGSLSFVHGKFPGLK